jgi:hypothetical protein
LARGLRAFHFTDILSSHGFPAVEGKGCFPTLLVLPNDINNNQTLFNQPQVRLRGKILKLISNPEGLAGVGVCAVELFWVFLGKKRGGLLS